MRKITRLERPVPQIVVKKKVAAYARISMETERMSHSLSAQISYYNNLIQQTPEWEFAGVYADDGISGTSIARREDFQRMIKDCEAGKIDIVLTKSIQRFARNTVDLLKTVRHLKDIGVEVRFEKENISSMSGDGELMLSILASFAQEESRSISENMKWAARKKFEHGIPNGRFRIYGYRWEGYDLAVVSKEAVVVKRIFQNVLDGKSLMGIERELEADGIRTRQGCVMSKSGLKKILANITYTGNLLLQKEFISDPINKKRMKNNGELPQYWVEDSHEAIIDMETFKLVQDEMARRKKLWTPTNKSQNITCFSGKIKCSVCGKSYRRYGSRQRKDPNEVYYIWICRTKSSKGTKFCNSKIIPEKTLERVCAEVLGLNEFDEDVFAEHVKQITVIGDDTLEFHFTDGKVLQKKWKSTAKKDWWTDERRKKWSEQHNTNPNRNQYKEFTGFIKCGKCGANYRSLLTTYVDGTKGRYWRCHKACGNTTIKDSTLKRLVCEVLELDEYSEESMNAFMKKAVIDDNTVTFHFNDGHTKSLDYKEKKRGARR